MVERTLFGGFVSIIEVALLRGVGGNRIEFHEIIPRDLPKV